MITDRISKEGFSSSSHKWRQIFRYLCDLFCTLSCWVSLPHARLLVKLLKLYFLQHQFPSPFLPIDQLKWSSARWEWLEGRGKSEDFNSFQTILPLVSQRCRRAPALIVTGSATRYGGVVPRPLIITAGWLNGGTEASQASISTRVCCRGQWEHVWTAFPY